MSENSLGEILGTNELERKVYILDITDGFPVSSAEELDKLFKNLFRNHNQINRFPIVATKEGRVYTEIDLTDDPRQQHKNLISELGVQDSDIIWTTSVDNVPPRNPATPCLLLDLGEKQRRITVSTGADAMASRELPGLIGEGPDKMKEIFGNIPGITPEW